MIIFDLLCSSINCSICCENITLRDKSCKTKCKHFFHYVCLNKWSQTVMVQKRSFNCPICRTDLSK